MHWICFHSTGWRVLDTISKWFLFSSLHMAPIIGYKTNETSRKSDYALLISPIELTFFGTIKMNSSCVTNSINVKNNQATKHTLNDKLNNTVNIGTYPIKDNHIHQTESQILISPQPLNIKVDTPTDWPTVIATLIIGVGSVLTTLLVGWLSHVNQRSQIRSSIASFRQSWVSELRETSAKFLASAAQLHLDIDTDNEYLSKSESNGQYSELIMLQSKIGLMLDKKHDNSSRLESLSEEIIKNIKANDTEKLNASANEFHSLMRDNLENAWQQIKRDLAGKK